MHWSTASFILPRKPLTLLKNTLVEGSEIKMEYNDTNALFNFEDTTIICQVQISDWPIYKRHSAMLNWKAFLKLLPKEEEFMNIMVNFLK